MITLNPVVVRLFRNLVLLELAIQAVFWAFGTYQTGISGAPPSTAAELLQVLESESTRVPIAIVQNPSVNVFNRPVSAVKGTQDYLGPRPETDTEADLQLLEQGCRGLKGTRALSDRVFDIATCLDFLARSQDRYYSRPPTLPSNSTWDERPSPWSVEFLGKCDGPIVPFHTYWMGKITWRVELFIKSYLFTQNHACSRLWLWLDADVEQDAVQKMKQDVNFKRFLPLLETGHIMIKSWRFPPRVRLPPDVKEHLNPRDQKYVKNDEDLNHLYVSIPRRLMPNQAAALSDAVRFIMVHLHGGVYMDMDMILLRDLRPLVLSRRSHAWAERWGTSMAPGEYNTAAISFPEMSGLSSYFLIGAIRSGVHFHPRAIGQMLVNDHRETELMMLEDGFFDPVWTMLDAQNPSCPVPCLRGLSDVFRNRRVQGEWDAYAGDPLPPPSTSADSKLRENDGGTLERLAQILAKVTTRTGGNLREALQQAGVITDYDWAGDPFPPTNRTLENFFKGAYSYHIHNQWSEVPEPSSWLDVIMQAHNDFFARQITNPYGEHWDGPNVIPYDFSPSHI